MLTGGVMCAPLDQPFKEAIEVTAEDFEHEVRQYSDLKHKYEALSDLLAVKDQMIWCDPTQYRHSTGTVQSRYSTVTV
eukprot:3067485-Pyramimonas_sp.AAC.1